MRRITALVFALAVAAVALDSPLFCVDGCDGNDIDHAQTTRVPCGSCVTCQAGSLPEAGLTPALSLVHMQVKLIDQLPPIAPPANAIDHPPRIS